MAPPAAAPLPPAPRRGVDTAGAAAGADSMALPSPGPTVRRFTFSTTTAFVRPWLKLWRTTPCSTLRLSVNVLVGVTVKVFSPGFLVSVITILVPEHCHLAAVKRGPGHPGHQLGRIRESASVREMS